MSLEEQCESIKKRIERQGNEKFNKFLDKVRDSLVVLEDGKPWIESYDMRGCLIEYGYIQQECKPRKVREEEK